MVVKADGLAKIGNFSISFEDMTVPAVGFPITVTRTYDSRDRTQSDFGHGWTYSINDVEVTESSTLGAPWVQVKNEYQQQRTPPPLPIPGMFGAGAMLPPGKVIEYKFNITENVMVDVTLPNGEVERFIMGYTGVRYTVEAPPLSETDVFIVPLSGSGTTSKLEPLASTHLLVQPPELGPVDFIDPETGEVWDPDRWKLTLKSGTVMILDENFGIETITDRNGNSVTFDENGITHTDGRGIAITRDDLGRVTKITDPAGKSILYEYDFYGDLVSVTDREQNVTRFVYDDEHNLLEIHDPLGRRGARTEYDENGRLIRMVNADGNVIDFDHDLDANMERVTDALGNTFTMVYDDRGNVVTEINPEGNVTRHEYDDFGNEKSLTVVLDDGSELTTTYTYDKTGNRLTETNPLGHETKYEYDSYGNVKRTTDPEGYKTDHAYGPNGNLFSVTDGERNSTFILPNPNGTSGKISDPGNGLTSFTYTESGKLSGSTDPLGLSRSYVYHDSGELEKESYTWVNPDDPSDVRTVEARNVLDDNGQVISGRDAYGHETDTVYDPVGNLKSTRDVLGNTTQYTYDANDRLIEVAFPDGTVVRAVYDAAGRETYATDRHDPDQSATSTHTIYDKAGRVVGTERLEGVLIEIIREGDSVAYSSFVSAERVLSSTSQEYDAAGRVTERTDENERITRFEYDAAGRQTAVISQGVRTEYDYDKVGNQTLVRDAQQRETKFEYDGLGRITRTTYPDGSFTGTTYDSQGRVASETDQAGRTTAYRYDAAGNLTRVILPAVPDPENGNQLTQPRYAYEYDRYGNLRLIRDPKGRETRFTYDEHNNQLTRTLPGGETEYKQYDEFGRLYREIDFKGQVTEYVYDQLSRVSQTWLFTSVDQADAGAPIATTTTLYDSANRPTVIVDVRGVNGIGYDEQGNVTLEVTPEGTIQYEYDPTTSQLVRTFTDRTDVQYGYDQLGRLQTVTLIMLDGQQLADPEVTRYNYDTLGHLDYTNLPNSVVVDYTYDDLDRLIDVVHRNADDEVLASCHYELTAHGLREEVTEMRLEDDGRYSERKVVYMYDTLDRLVREVSTDLTGTQPEVAYTTAYIYDLVGNRLERETSDASGTETVSYSYDVNDRLFEEMHSSGETVTYGYDANGSLVTKHVDGVLVEQYEYNVEGRLVKATVHGGQNGLPVVTVTKYVYNIHGMKVAEEVSVSIDGGDPAVAKKSFVVDAQNPTGFAQVLEEHDGTGALRRTYILGQDVIAQAARDAAEMNFRYFGYDGQMSTRILTDPSGAVTDRYDYDASGRALNFDPALAATSLLYTGEAFDTNLQQYYLRARWLDPATGRFNRLDSLGGDEFDPQTLHKYGYVNSDPINNLDPSGEFFMLMSAMMGGLSQAPMFPILAWLTSTITSGIIGAASYGSQAAPLFSIGGNATGQVYTIYHYYRIHAALRPLAREFSEIGSTWSGAIEAFRNELTPLRNKALSGAYSFMEQFNLMNPIIHTIWTLIHLYPVHEKIVGAYTFFDAAMNVDTQDVSMSFSGSINPALFAETAFLSVDPAGDLRAVTQLLRHLRMGHHVAARAIFTSAVSRRALRSYTGVNATFIGGGLPIYLYSQS